MDVVKQRKKTVNGLASYFGALFWAAGRTGFGHGRHGNRRQRQ